MVVMSRSSGSKWNIAARRLLAPAEVDVGAEQVGGGEQRDLGRVPGARDLADGVGGIVDELGGVAARRAPR